jgi:hypothetical protein
VIHHLTDLPAETPSRSAKRRRTEIPTSEATAGQRDEALDTPFDDETTARGVIETYNAIHSDLQARIATGAGASSVYGNGAAPLLQNTFAHRMPHLL